MSEVLVDNIVRMMQRDGLVWIRFKSMNSDKSYKKLYKPCDATPLHRGNKLVVIDAETGEYEDIEKSTIIGWGVYDVTAHIPKKSS